MIITEVKLPILPDSPQQIFLPFFTAKEAAKAVLKVDTQKDIPKMWYQEDIYSNHEEIDNEFFITALRNNHNYGDHILRELYIGSASILRGSSELHYFILPPDTIKEAIHLINPLVFFSKIESVSITEK